MWDSYVHFLQGYEYVPERGDIYKPIVKQVQAYYEAQSERYQPSFR